MRGLRELLLPWKNNKYYMFVYVRACVCVRAHACALARGLVPAGACV